jgi:hypothetical protein
VRFDLDPTAVVDPHPAAISQLETITALNRTTALRRPRMGGKLAAAGN